MTAMGHHRRIPMRNVARLRMERRLWKKTREFVLRDKGLYGPIWLHRLVLRVAANLGMVGYGKSYEVFETYRSVSIDSATIEGQIFQAAKAYLRDYTPGELVVLCGWDQFAEITHGGFGSMRFKAPVRIGGLEGAPRAQLYNFDVVLVEHIEGLVVLPKRVLADAAGARHAEIMEGG